MKLQKRMDQVPDILCLWSMYQRKTSSLILHVLILGDYTCKLLQATKDELFFGFLCRPAPLWSSLFCLSGQQLLNCLGRFVFASKLLTLQLSLCGFCNLISLLLVENFSNKCKNTFNPLHHSINMLILHTVQGESRAHSPFCYLLLSLLFPF